MQRVLLFALFCLAVNCQVVLHLTTRTDQFYFGSLICLGYGQSNVTINYFNIPVKTVIKMNPVISSNQTVCDTDLEYSTAITCGTANVEVTISPANSTSGYPWTATFAFSEADGSGICSASCSMQLGLAAWTCETESCIWSQFGATIYTVYVCEMADALSTELELSEPLKLGFYPHQAISEMIETL